MKATFRKSLLAAGTAAAIAGVSSNAFAAIHSDVGEAYLVPFAVWGDISPQPGQTDGSFVDTIFQITVPSAIGGKTIPNVYTAPNTTPNHAATPPGTAAIGLDQRPFDIFGPPIENLAQWELHWIFYDYRSGELANGPWTISPELYTHVSLQDDMLRGALENEAGYVVWVTQAGYAGNDANFVFVVDAFLVADNDGDVLDDVPGTLVTVPYSQVAFQIPAYPMSDAADGTDLYPTPLNNVLESRNDVSPIASAISTYWPVTDLQLGSAVHVIDLAVTDRTDSRGANNIYDAATLMVIWNQVNGVQPLAGVGLWGSVSTDLFNDIEDGCSRSIPLPNELNLIWFTSGVSPAPGPVWGTGGDYARPIFLDTNPGVPGLLPAQSQNWTLAQQAQCENQDDAFIRFQLPLVSNDADHRTSAAAFSLNVWWNGAFLLPRADGEFAYPTDEANDRGTFLNQANKYFGLPLI